MINRKTSLFSLFFLLFLFTSISSASVTKKKILILYSLQPRMPAFEVLDQNFRNLQLNKDTQVEYFTEYLEQNRFRDEKSVKKQADLINHKYKINKPDIVIAVMSPALDFIQKYCKTTFNNIPIVYALIDKKVDPKNMEIKATGVNLHIDLLKTLKAALSVQPETRDVYVVVGTSALGRSWEAQAKEKFQQLSGQINFHYLSDLSMVEVLHKVSKLPPQAIVLYLLIIKDASGKSFVPRDALDVISRSSSVPVYGLWSTYVGHGIIGGYLCSSDLLGKNVNKMVVRILNGESLDKVHPISLGPSINMFDWRQMKRFGISEKRIPDENIILFKAQTGWDKYRIYILCLFLFLSIESLLVFILIMSIKKRKIAESELTETNKILLTEIKQRKKTEVVLKESEKSLKASQRIAHLGNWRLDLSTNKVVWTKELYEMYGFDPTLPVPPYTEHMKLFTPESWERLSASLARTSETGIAYELELETVREDGSKGWMWVRGEAEKDSEGKTIGLWGAAQDITERKRNEGKLSLQSEIITRMSEGVSLVGEDGLLIYTNPGFEKMFGYDSGEMIGLHVSIVNAPIEKHPEKTAKEIVNSLNNEGIWFGEIQNVKKDRTTFWSAASATVIEHLKHGKAFVSVHTDISELKQMKSEKKNLEVKLQQAQKMESIGTLAGGIAHDFNNILFPIVGHTEMLLEDVSEDSPFRASLNEIYTGALRASELVKQILTFSRQESGELKLMKMQPIIKEALKLIRSTIPTTIAIKQDLSPACGVIKADPTQIHQIVMNLTTNAYHAMEDTGGELKVSLNEVELGALDLINPNMATGVYVCLTVADTGKGMDKNIINKIFDPFFTTKEKGKGTGMGLSVIHGIVTSMNGAIQVYSEPGKGTVFNVYLPVEKSPFTEQISNSNLKIQRGIEKILLVDDEEAILSMEKLMLERLGYHVTSRTSSIEALETFRAAPDKFDLVITDMAMPNMPGNKLSAELIKIRPGIPVLLCTGFSETMSEEKAASIGIKGFLWKPIVMKDLSQKIREVLDK